MGYLVERLDQKPALKEHLLYSQQLFNFGSWTYEVESKHLLLSDKMFDLLGCPQCDPGPESVEYINFVHPADRQILSEAVNKALQTAEVEGIIYRVVTSQGKEKYVYGKIKAVQDNGKPARLLGIVQEIADQEQMAVCDLIAGLPNRHAFNRNLDQMCEQAQQDRTQFALMMVEVDGLKQVYFNAGYETERQLLKMVVERIRSCLDDGSFLSRYSDSCFALIIPDVKSPHRCAQVARMIIDGFKETCRVDGWEFDLAVNIGITICPQDGLQADVLKKKALFNLVKAKKEGKNTYRFQDAHSNRQFILYNDLPQALEKNQLKVFYQPIVALKTSQLLGAEALLRWKHPEWGMISPGEFIPIAEESGLIIDMGKWILHDVCRTYREWLDRGMPPIKVSVNFSDTQLFEDNFVNNFLSIVAEYDLNPDFLIIELSEKALMNSSAKIISNIQGLQQSGVQIALDDFGGSLSSLVYLSANNIDIIKLDRSLIHNFMANEANAIITRSIINMGRELNMKIVAEGIEREEQLVRLKECNCFAGQGYIYDKPLERDQFEEVLARRKCRPSFTSSGQRLTFENRRRFFRIKFYQLLEADMTILEIKGKKLDLGKAKVLVKDMGAGGLCFISNIKLPVEKHFTLQFTTCLLGQEIKLNGVLAWGDRLEGNLYIYGVEFVIDEMERMELIKVLNQVQIKMRKSFLFGEGSFVSLSPAAYYSQKGK